MTAQPVVNALGDSGVTVSFSDQSSRATTEKVRLIGESIRGAAIPHVDEVVAAYTAVTVFYDSLHVSYDVIGREILSICANPRSVQRQKVAPREHVVRVEYNGPDLESVASATGLSADDVVEIHSAGLYHVDLLGFVPGFAYLSELDQRLELPRREQPRPRVAAGSVAIAARLTGVYPFDTPGGWHIIGHTGTTMFDPRRAEPSLFRHGDRVRFEPAR